MVDRNLPKNYLEHIKDILGENEFNEFHKFIMENEVKKSVTFNNFRIDNVREAEQMFYNCSNLQTIYVDFGWKFLKYPRRNRC